MHIDSIQLLRVPLRPESSSVPLDKFESVFVEFRSGDDVGFGEVTLARGPHDCAEWSAGAFACLRDWLAPALVGRELNSGDDLQDALRPFQGNARAKSALDVAWWSLAATVQKKPLHRLLGATRATIPLSCTLGVMDSTERLFAEIGEAFKAYELVTLEFRPGWDLEMLRAVRQAFSSEPIAIDCDALCTLGQQEIFYRLEDFFLKHIEQPLAADDLVAHAMLQSSIRTPICLDQSVTSLERVEQAIDLGSCQMVRIDVGRVGGLTPALAIRDACRLAKIPCGVGGGPHNEIAASAAAALAASCELPLPHEAYSWRKEPGLMSDETTLTEVNAAGKFEIRLPADVPGWGFLLDTEIVADAAVERATII
jgi:O-succinylbenzoate synthase